MGIMEKDEALKPDKIKLSDWIDSILLVSYNVPHLENTDMKQFLNNAKGRLNVWAESLKKNLGDLA